MSYLLEKTRVVGQETGERNYHIFYYLLVGAPKELKKELQLDLGGDSTVAELCCEPFYYVNNGSETFTTPKSDAKRFQQVSLLDVMCTVLERFLYTLCLSNVMCSHSLLPLLFPYPRSSIYFHSPNSLRPASRH